jgi:ParB family chromosome partitioning protein
MSEQATIEVSKIAPPTKALREVNPESPLYQELVESIRINGFISTPTVIHAPDVDQGTEYEIIDGNNRLHAAVDAGLTEIPVLILESWEEAKTIAAQLMMNVNHIPMKPTEQAAALREILHCEPDFKVDDLAKKLGKSRSYVEKQLSLNKLTDGIKALVDDGTIVASNAHTLSKVPAELQDDLAEDAIALSVEEFGVKVKEVLKAARADANAGGASKEFTPKPKNRTLQSMEQEIALAEEGSDDSEALQLLISQDTDQIEEALILGLQFAIQMDPVSLEQAKLLFETNQKEREDKRATAKQAAADRAVAKAEKDLADKRARAAGEAETETAA